jgi:hypothetical protein
VNPSDLVEHHAVAISSAATRRWFSASS